MFDWRDGIQQGRGDGSGFERPDPAQGHPGGGWCGKTTPRTDRGGPLPRRGNGAARERGTRGGVRSQTVGAGTRVVPPRAAGTVRGGIARRRAARMAGMRIVRGRRHRGLSRPVRRDGRRQRRRLMRAEHQQQRPPRRAPRHGAAGPPPGESPQCSAKERSRSRSSGSIGRGRPVFGSIMTWTVRPRAISRSLCSSKHS